MNYSNNHYNALHLLSLLEQQQRRAPPPPPPQPLPFVQQLQHLQQQQQQAADAAYILPCAGHGSSSTMQPQIGFAINNTLVLPWSALNTYVTSCAAPSLPTSGLPYTGRPSHRHSRDHNIAMHMQSHVNPPATNQVTRQWSERTVVTNGQHQTVSPGKLQNLQNVQIRTSTRQPADVSRSISATFNAQHVHDNHAHSTRSTVHGNAFADHDEHVEPLLPPRLEQPALLSQAPKQSTEIASSQQVANNGNVRVKDEPKNESVSVPNSTSMMMSDSAQNGVTEISQPSMRRICQFCHKTFSTKWNLKAHNRIHTGERPFRCDLCPMAFRQKHTLQNHRRTHTGERPYECSFCGKCFTVKHNRDTHARIHSGKRPYACPHCTKRFSSKSAFNSHVKRMHDET